jgi:hypothetical protein
MSGSTATDLLCVREPLVNTGIRVMPPLPAVRRWRWFRPRALDFPYTSTAQAPAFTISECNRLHQVLQAISAFQSFPPPQSRVFCPRLLRCGIKLNFIVFSQAAWAV